ncbi:hypothetical protein [Ramlibacter albus]|uniref:Lipoprotein n=1 Tax=Ramlibacter albus TaxID=2079448 RepID=A0A923M4Q5_9BURK|nr:hypothetical protein [Ramlibacter albus]MBC5764157.1 hypothetical protein [Ramlibacter albus]
MKWPIIIMAGVLSGCGSLPKDQQQVVDQAKNLCSVVNLNQGRLKLSATMKVNGQTTPQQVVDTSKIGAVGERAVFQTLVQQDLCMLSYTMPSFPSDKLSAWAKETSLAFDAWKPVVPATYAADITALRNAENEHLARIKGWQPSKGTPMSFELFNAAIPRQDFLTVVSVDAGFQFGPAAKFEFVKFDGSSGKLVLCPSEISVAIRPALNGVRQAVGRYAMGHSSDRDMVSELVSAVYNAGATRIQESQDAAKVKPAATAIQGCS